MIIDLIFVLIYEKTYQVMERKTNAKIKNTIVFLIGSLCIIESYAK